MAVEKSETTHKLLFVFRCIPLTVRKILFIIFFSLFYHLITRRRLIVLHNLQRSLPEKDIKEIIKIAKGVYRHFAIVVAEFFDMSSITKENIHKWVDVEGMENYQAAIAKGRGVLSIVAHFGNWELMTIAVPLYIKPMYIVYRPLDNPIIDNMVEYVRTMQGNVLIPKGGSGKKILELLKENQIIGILSDQNVAAYEGVLLIFSAVPLAPVSGWQ